MSASEGRARNPVRRAVSGAARRAPWLVDAYRVVRNPRWELDLFRDLVHTRRSAAFLRDLVAPAGAPRAVFGLYRDNVYDTKLALVLSSALRFRGVDPVVLMPSNRAHRVRRYAGAFGPIRVIATDLVPISATEVAECADAGRALLAGPLGFDDIKQWRFRSWHAGSHVLSTLIRTTFDGSPDLHVDENRERLQAIVDEVLVNYVRYEHVIDELRPQVVLVDEANYSTNGPLVDVAVAGGTDVVQTIGTWRDDALMSKRLTRETRRIDAKSVSSATLARVSSEPWTPERDAELDADFAARYGGRWVLGQQFQPGTERRSPAEITRELGLDPERRTAVVFAHVLWDASLFYGVDLFANYSDWLVQTVAAAVRNSDVNWVVKAHPSNVFRVAHGDIQGESSEITLLRENFPDLPQHVHVLLPDTRISTLSLYEFADYGVTVRGTPGMEMACYGKPVFTAGTGTYAGLGFTYDSSSVTEYLERLAKIATYDPLPPAMTAAARRYAHTLFLRRPWPARSFRIDLDFPEQGWHPLDRNVELTVRTVDELRRSTDLAPWAAWVMDSRDDDYLAPPG